jgi:hypothetical protein
MRQWEYKLKEVQFSDENLLTELGLQGWEAVSVDWNFRPATMLILFKRSTGKA